MIPSLSIIILLIAICLIAEAFFSGAEIAFLSASKPKILRRAKEKDPAAGLVKKLLANPEYLFSTTVVGTTVAISSATTLATIYILHHYGNNYEWINLVVLTPVILIFGEFVPKMFARSRPDNLVLSLATPLRFFGWFLYPLTTILSIYAQALKLILGESPDKSFFLSREEIKAALPASQGSDVTHSERVLIERILEFQKTTVKEMFHPLIDVIAIEEKASLKEALQLMGESGHSRLPVYQGRVDRIVGVIMGFDCLNSTDLNVSVKSFMREPFFVPESKPVDELLLELRKKPMAIAVNEFGGAEGIITMEDVVEEIVGDIEDEYDQPPKMYYRIGENSYIVNARMEIDAIRENLHIDLPKDDEEYQTLGGFLLHKMQHIPKKWDAITIDGIEYIIQSATDRTIEEVYLILHKPKAPETTGEVPS